MSLLGCLAITEGYIVAYLATKLQKESYTISQRLIGIGDNIAANIIHDILKWVIILIGRYGVSMAIGSLRNQHPR